MITVHNDYKETVSPRSPLSDLFYDTTPLIDVKDSIHDTNAYLNDEMESPEASSSALSAVEKNWEPSKKVRTLYLEKFQGGNKKI